jgi:outer membrane cobalamin receptor
MKFFWICTVLGTVVVPTMGRADDEAEEAIVRAQRAPSSETVIGHAEIERTGGTTVADALRPSADVDLFGGGAGGSNGRLTLRGSSPEETLLVVDGLRMSSRSSAALVGGADPNIFPSVLLQNIMIVRGPTSALWGANAVSGYVHLTTREPTTPRLLSGTMQFSSYLSDQVGDASFVPRPGIDRDFEYGPSPLMGARGSVVAALRDRERFAVVGLTGSYSRGWFPNTESQLLDATFKLGRTLTRGGTAYIWARAYEARTGAPSSSSLLESDTFDADDRQHRRGSQTAAVLRHVLTPRETLEATASVAIAHTRLFNPDADRSMGTSNTESLQRGSEMQARVAYVRRSMGSLGLFTLGADIGHEALATEEYETSAMRGSLFVRDQRFLGVVALDFACRLDGDTQYGWQVSPRFALLVRPRSDAFRAEISVGRAYRPPTFSERLWPEFTYATSRLATGERGNDTLVSESAWGVDASVAVQGDMHQWQVNARAFGLRTESLIRWALDFQRFWTPTNVTGTVVSLGGSADASVRVMPSLTLLASAFWQTTRDDQGDEISGRLRSKITGRAVWFARNGVRAWAEALWFDRTGTNSVGTAWQGIFLNARVGWQSASGFGFFALGENLTDTRFESARGVPSPGRTLWVGVALDMDED